MERVTRGLYSESVYKEHTANRWKFLEPMNPAESPGFMLETPIPVLACTLSYLAFVCFVGPVMMRNRKPYELKNLIRLYNLLMVALAAILLQRIYNSMGSLGSLADCNRVFSLTDHNGTKVRQMANFILMVRISEYFDTIFFTLRKKQNQVTFLHVFHHTFVPLYAYWILRTAPVRFNNYIILINSFVHVLMYSYYFLATFQSRAAAKEQRGLLMSIVNKLLLFKKYMTQLQILQFVSLGLYCVWAALKPNMCNVPGTYIASNFLLAFGFLALFLHFYLRSYRARAEAVAAKKRAA